MSSSCYGLLFILIHIAGSRIIPLCTDNPHSYFIAIGRIFYLYSVHLYWSFKLLPLARKNQDDLKWICFRGPGRMCKRTYFTWVRVTNLPLCPVHCRHTPPTLCLIFLTRNLSVFLPHVSYVIRSADKIRNFFRPRTHPLTLGIGTADFANIPTIFAFHSLTTSLRCRGYEIR